MIVSIHARSNSSGDLRGRPCRREPSIDIEYCKAGGASLKLDAWIPDGQGPFPAVIVVHGGGWQNGDKQVNCKPLFDPLSQAGFAWFTVNYRLAPAHRYPAAVDDVVEAIRYVESHAREYKVDLQRVGSRANPPAATSSR